MAPICVGLAGMPMRQPGTLVAIGVQWIVTALDDR